MALAAGAKVGTGYVEIEPDFSRFQEKLGKRLSQALTPALRKAGRNAGKDMASGLGQGGLGQALTPLLRRFEKFGDDAGKAIAAKVGGGSQRAAGDMFGLADAVRAVEEQSRRARRGAKPLETDMFGIGRAARDSGKKLRSAGSELRDWHARADASRSSVRRLSERLRELGGDLLKTGRGLRVTSSGFGGFDGVMARVNRGFSFFRNILRTLKWPTLIAGVGLALQGLSALAAAAVATTAALSPLGGVLIALPAAALAAAQAFGVLKLATAGIGGVLKAAYSAETQGGQQAVDVMRQQESAAERVADAKRNLASVERDATFAQEDLTKAREDAVRTLQDMRLESERSRDSEQQGALQLRQARQELAKTLRDPSASGLDVRFAEEAVDQARNDLQQTRLDAQRAREDYAKAQKGGVTKMPEVVAAKRAEADANRSVTDAERDLEQAVKDSTEAMKDQGSAATAFQQQMAQLPPAAQKFVRVLLALKPRLDELRATAASGFFPGAEAGLKGLMGNFREVKGVVADTAGALGKIAAKAGRKLGSVVWGKDLARLGKLNTRIIGRMGDAGLNLADSFRHILVSAEPFLDWLSESTKEFSGWIENEAEAGRKSGALAEFFDRTRETMERLGPILKGVGGALLNIGEAARPLGNEILDALGSSAEGWRKWTDSTKGENKLKRYFTEVKPAIFEMGKLIGALGKAFFELGKQRGVAELLKLVRTELIPALRDTAGAVTGWASDFIREFSSLRKEGVPTFDAFVRTVVNHAGRAGLAIAKALVGAFLNAGILGKLAVTGWLISRFGGFRAFAAMGAKAGGQLGKAMVKKIIGWLAGTEAGISIYTWLSDAVGPSGKLGKSARVGGARLGKIFGRSLMLGAVAALAALGPMLADEVRKYIRTPVQKALEDLPGPLGEIGHFANNVADTIGKNIPETLNPGAPIIRRIFKDDEEEVPEPKTDKAQAKLRAFADAVAREGERARKGFKGSVSQLPDIAEHAGRGAYRQMIPRLDALAHQGGQKGDAFASHFGGSFRSLSETVNDALANIETNVGGAFKGLKAGKLPKFNLKKLVQSLPVLPPMAERQRGGLVPAFAAGGLASVVPGQGTGDRHTLSLNGRPVAKVESKEGIFVGNRNLMGALKQANAAVPRFQGGGFVGRLRRGGLAEPRIAGQDGPLRELGQKAIQKVFKGAKDFLAKQKSQVGGLANLSVPTGPIVQMARQMVGRIWGRNEWTPFAALETQEANWDPKAENPTTGAAGLAQALLPSKYPPGAWPYRGLESAKLQLQWMMQYIRERYGSPSAAWLHEQSAGWYQSGGLLKAAAGPLNRLAHGGLIDRVGKLLASGGMVDPGWDAGSETISGSIAQLVAAYAKRFDIDITAGYDPGGGHVSPGHNTTGTATDVVPRDGNWDGTFAKGLETLTGMGFEVGYDGSIPGTQSWPDHGRGNHAHIEWVGNGTAPDARRQLREFLSGAGSSSGASDAGSSAPPKEEIPASYRGAKTDPLDLGQMPKTLEGVNKEISRWQGEVGTYRKAKRYAEKHNRPGVAQAVGKNVAVIEGRLGGLRALRTRLRLQSVKKGLKKRLGKRLKQFAGYEQLIEGSQRGYERVAQDTQQLVELEPQSPELKADATDKEREAADKAYVANFTDYVNTRERPAYAGVLGQIADWRNTILRAEIFGFGKDQPSVARVETRWESEDLEISNTITRIKDFSKKVGEHLATFKSEHPKAKKLPDWLQKEVNERAAMLKDLPILQTKDTGLRKAIGEAREKFFPGGPNRLKPNAAGVPAMPLPGSGSFEGSLEDVQGIHWPDLHELLSASDLVPPRIPGRFGGVIWDVQGSIEELGLKINQAANSLGGPSEKDDSESKAFFEEQARQANQRAAVSDTQKVTLEGWDKMRQGLFAKLPKFHAGGTVIGPANRETPIMALGRERIRTPEQELAMAAAIRELGEGGGGEPNIEITFYEGERRATVRHGDQDVEATVKRIVKGTRGIGVLTPGGARR